jgi:transglutaminase-like putative cysteine protease
MSGEKTIYYAIEMQGTLCGYSEIAEFNVIHNDLPSIRQESHTQISIALMGRKVETIVDIHCVIDSLSSQVVETGIELEQGKVLIHAKSTFEDGLATQIDLLQLTGDHTVEIPNGTVVENTLYKKHVVNDFRSGEHLEKSYPVFVEMKGEVAEKHYIFKGFDTLLLCGEYYPVIVVEESVPIIGLKSTLWLDDESGLLVKEYVPNQDRTRYLSDNQVAGMVKHVDYEDMIFYKVNHVIPSFKDMTYLKIDVDIKSLGSEITHSSLNLPGQKFTGTVIDNHIVGTFEIEPKRYSGEDPPVFPPDFEITPELKKYLEPGDFIESEDPDIVRKAKEITNGSANAWEAAMRLSRWIDVNISGAIPGGGTAKGTLESREAECGGHSRLLTAFCRAVGIPARVPIGCMYIPKNGGFFGQHAWTEIYMGDHGWIGVDPTNEEVEYIDAGHIRLSEKSTFHPKSMKIIEYKLLGEQEEDPVGTDRTDLNPTVIDPQGVSSPVKLNDSRECLLIHTINGDNLGYYRIHLSREFTPGEEAYLDEKYAHMDASQFEDLKEKLCTIRTGEIAFFYIKDYGFYEGHTDWRADPVEQHLSLALNR